MLLIGRIVLVVFFIVVLFVEVGFVVVGIDLSLLDSVK